MRIIHTNQTKKIKNMVNKVTLIGNLGKAPEVRKLESGATVARFTLATNENYRDKSGEWQTNTEWHDIVLWRNLAERAESQLDKGSLVYIDGKLSHRIWEDKDGNSRKNTEVIANYFRRIDKRDDVGGGSPVSSNASTPTNDAQKESSDQPSEESSDDDLPF